MRVMIVEDDLRLLGILQSQLRRAGHEVYGALNGRIAWAQLQQTQPDVIITDWKMPEMDGVELCRAIRAHPALRDTYIIMLSGQGNAEDQAAGMRAGADDYLTKPCSIDRLLRSVRSAAGATAQRLEPARSDD